ncbi:type II toxin-antitoxin system Phd/YefM family antitoxin [Polynucleobacter sp. IMCC 30228]|uniref:type II toxin-antitoxin system Phd/YefM family antitoxin n=1 Tax=Polynucleobacter sp. IMCC 30228 TaxID=2781011 RepID=UPI001F46DC4C|nr:type II toxin-antitoxin system Phd/YefM family antitoxin [Polynucleobacter sp. IMCC 30228]MCE7528258.1 type II toxin-antitoxin system Phd/YefM family antitoxin [Polynucleobacter sp. IMCC 30228]
MKSNWAVQDAKARFSEFLNACLSDGPQVVTKRGLKAAVLITIQEWDALRESAHPTLKDLLLSDQDRTELPLPKRGQLQRRKLTQI